MLLLLLTLGCSATPAAPAAPPTPECLDKADLADGAADHVVHKCANCSLVMDGDPKFSSTVEGYTFHSCSATCQASLEAAPGEVVARACTHK